MPETIKIGVIGTGFIGPAHIEAAQRTFMAEIVALADVDDETANLKAKQFAIKQYFGNYQDLLRDDEIELVHVCTPNFLHYRMCKDALLADKHVICEKPLAMNRREAEELVELAEKKGLDNAVHFNIRYYPLVCQSAWMIKTGDIGSVLAVHGSYLQDWLFYETDYNWRLEPDLSGESRAIADIGSHWMDLIEYITCQRIGEVMADIATFHKTRKKPLKAVETYVGKMLHSEDYHDVPISTEDYASVLLHFENGARGAFTVNQVAAGRKNRCSFEINGSRCSLFWDSEKPNDLWIGHREKANECLLKDPSLVGDEARSIISFPGGHNEGFPDTAKQLFRDVYQRVLRSTPKKTAPNYPTFRDGLREIILCEAIIASAREKRWIEVH